MIQITKKTHHLEIIARSQLNRFVVVKVFLQKMTFPPKGKKDRWQELGRRVYSLRTFEKYRRGGKIPF